MKTQKIKSSARFIAILAILISFVSITSCAPQHQSCEAYQNIDLASESSAE